MQLTKFIAILLMGMLISCSNAESKKETVFKFKGTNIFIVNSDSLILFPEKGLVYYKDEPFTGISFSNYITGQKAVSIEYMNGKKDGTYKKWFENGILSFESEYVNGKRHGITKSWWLNSNLRSEANYESGVAHGDQLQWYNSGAKFKHIQLNQGIEEGLQKSWRENGKLYNNYEAKNGRIFGLKRSNLCYELDDEEIQYKN